VPSLGQGATQAIEDGCAFVALFHACHGSATFDVPALTAAFAALRGARIEFVKRFSWDASRPLLAGSDPVISNRERAEPAYRAKLRRLYTDIGIASLSHRER
jgi:salicylate hydroxylase